MAKHPLDPRAQPQRFDYRAGQKGFVWEGIATKVDPGGSPPNRPRDIRNMRLQGGSIITRPDFGGPGTVVPATPIYDPDVFNGSNRPTFDITGGYPGNYVPWFPHWTAELNSVGGTRLWWGSKPPLEYQDPPGVWVATGTGSQYGYIDTDMDPVFNVVGLFNTNDSWAAFIEKYNREVYVADYGSLKKVYQINSQPGLQNGPIDILSEPAVEIIAAFPGFRPTSMLEFQGKLYFLLSDPFTLNNAEIWSWDGFQVVQEYVLADPAAAGSAMKEYKNTLIVTVSGWGSFLELKSGSWSVITPGGGYDSSPLPNCMAAYRDKLYIMDGVDKIWSWDGTTATLEHTISATDAEMGRPGSGIAAVPINAFCCINFNDRLYYGWTDGAVSPNLVTMGCHDLDNEATYQWNDPWVDGSFIDTVPDGPGADGGMTAMGVYRGRIIVAMGQYPTGNSAVYSHFVQNAPYTGWWLWGNSTGGRVLDQGLGPLTNGEVLGNFGTAAPQINYFTTI